MSRGYGEGAAAASADILGVEGSYRGVGVAKMGFGGEGMRFRR